MAQFELFTTAPPQSAAPSADEVRARLQAILAALRAGDKWDERQTRYWRVVVPQMAQWLPADERPGLIGEFERLLAARSDAA
jgi:hypothetical protein